MINAILKVIKFLIVNGLLDAGSLMRRRDLYWGMMESCSATLDRVVIQHGK